MGGGANNDNGTHRGGKSIEHFELGEPEERKPRGVRGRRWRDNIKMDIKNMV